MKPEIIKIIRSTWCEYYLGNKAEAEKDLEPADIPVYEEAMLRLETDFDYQKELGLTW